MKLEGKTALITGGGTGIGAAIAERFVAEGARVCISGRRREILEAMVKKLPEGMATMCPGDTSNDGDVTAMIEATVAFGGGIDVLVNNAAVNSQGPVADLDRAMWRMVLDVNRFYYLGGQEGKPTIGADGAGLGENEAPVDRYHGAGDEG